MTQPEARVLIMGQPCAGLVELVEGAGGQVVGAISSLAEAHLALDDPAFPTSAGNPNVVVSGDRFQEPYGHGSDGKNVLALGYKRGIFHGAGMRDGIGAVVIGCSQSSGWSDIVAATGVNLAPLDDPAAGKRWAEALIPHPVQPRYLSPGIMERRTWSSVTFDDLMSVILGVERPRDSDLSIKAHALSSVRQVVHNNGVSIIDSDEVAFARLGLNEVMTWKTDHSLDTFGRQIIKAIIEPPSGGVYVIQHVSQFTKRSWGTDKSMTGRADKIALGGLTEIPDAYWESLGLEKPSSLQA